MKFGLRNLFSRLWRKKAKKDKSPEKTVSGKITIVSVGEVTSIYTKPSPVSEDPQPTSKSREIKPEVKHMLKVGFKKRTAYENRVWHNREGPIEPPEEDKKP